MKYLPFKILLENLAVILGWRLIRATTDNLTVGIKFVKKML